MPAPKTPRRLDGALLTPKQSKRFQRLANAIWSDAPQRTDAAILKHAAGAFRLTAQRSGRKWADVSSVRLNGGNGPVLVLDPS